VPSGGEHEFHEAGVAGPRPPPPPKPRTGGGPKAKRCMPAAADGGSAGCCQIAWTLIDSVSDRLYGRIAAAASMDNSRRIHEFKFYRRSRRCSQPVVSHRSDRSIRVLRLLRGQRCAIHVSRPNCQSLTWLEEISGVRGNLISLRSEFMKRSHLLVRILATHHPGFIRTLRTACPSVAIGAAMHQHLGATNPT
jgi:hypothetical protein